MEAILKVQFWSKEMLTVGLIGAGRIGRVHASTISMHANSKLVAVADVIEDNA